MRALVGFVIGLALVVIPAATRAVEPRRDFPTSDRWVGLAAISGDRAFLGGNFSSLGAPYGGFAVVDTVSGALLPTPHIAGRVLCTADDGDGGFFLGGLFTAIDGVPRQNLAHVLRDGRVAAWDPGSDGAVRQMVRDQDRLYVGGDFTRVASTSRTRLAMLSTTTGAASAWAPAAPGSVQHLLLRDGTVYFHSDLPRVSGPPQQEVAAADAVSGLSTSFHVHLQGEIRGFDVRDTVAYFGGVFDSVAGAARLNIAAVGIPSGQATSWAPQTNRLTNPHQTPPTVNDVAVYGGRVYLAGAFSQIDGLPRAGVAAVTVGEGTLLPWQPSGFTRGGPPSGFTFDGDRAFLRFAVQPTTPAFPAVVLVDTLTGAAGAWDPRLQGATALAMLSGDRIALAGPFLMVEPQAHHQLAAIDLPSGQLLDWTVTADGNLFSIAAADTVVYIGGEFTHVNGVERHGLAALSASSGAVLPWDPLPAPQPYVATWTLAVQGGQVQAGLQIGLQQYLRSFDRAPQAGVVWSHDLDLPASALAVDGARLFVGGAFRRVDTTDRLALAALEGSSGLLEPWDPRATLDSPDPAQVLALTVLDGTVYMAGSFQRVASQPRNGLAAVDAATGSLRPWAPEIRVPRGTHWTSRHVSTLEASGSRIYAGGVFETGDPSQPNTWLAAWRADPSLADPRPLPWDPHLDEEVLAVRSAGPWTYAFGNFERAGGYLRMGLAAFDTTLDAALPQPPITDVSGSLRLSPNPSQAGVAFEWDVRIGARVKFTLFDVQGRRLAQLAELQTTGAPLRWSWDGRADGRRLRAGLYLLQAELDGRSFTRRLVRIP